MPTTRTPDQIRADFDRIARLPAGEPSNNDRHHAFLLRRLRGRPARSLDVGCGTGAFARQLAARSGQVLGIDLSPVMIEVARETSRAFPALDYRVADVMTADFPAGHFDCIASIATLHHLPLDVVLARLAGWLKPGGMLLVLDLSATEWRSLPIDAWSAVLRWADVRLHPARFPAQPDAAEAWHAHGRDETYLTASEVRRVCRAVLPGAVVRQHLYWRWSLVWERGTDG